LLGQKMIVWLASFPRSGNTMVRSLLHRVYGCSSYSLYEEHPVEGAKGAAAIPAAIGSAGQATGAHLEQLRRRRDPCFVKTHGAPTDDSPAICLIRDGRDALVSYTHFLQAFEPETARQYSFDELLRILMESRDHYGGWTDNVRAWYGRTAVAPTVWLRYEDLVADPFGQVERALAGLDLAIAPAGSPPIAFSELHRRWPDFFRVGKPGAWRREMSEQLHELFWRHHEEPMRWFAYER
jgi:Sulfotransferase domain